MMVYSCDRILYTMGKCFLYNVYWVKNNYIHLYDKNKMIPKKYIKMLSDFISEWLGFDVFDIFQILCNEHVLLL